MSRLKESFQAHEYEHLARSRENKLAIKRKFIEIGFPIHPFASGGLGEGGRKEASSKEAFFTSPSTAPFSCLYESEND